jgi:hypothetical protein
MRRRRVDADHQIQIVHEGGGIGEIADRAGEIENLWTVPLALEVGQLAFALAFLQAVESNVGVFQRREFGERNIAPLIDGYRLVRANATRPYKPDAPSPSFQIFDLRGSAFR